MVPNSKIPAASLRLLLSDRVSVPADYAKADLVRLADLVWGNGLNERDVQAAARRVKQSR